MDYPIPKTYVYATKGVPIEEIILAPKVTEVDDIVPFFAETILGLHNYATEKVNIS